MELALRINEETNEIEGDIPEPLQSILHRVEETAETRGRGKGIEQAAADARKQIEDAVASKVRELEAKAPFDKARLSQLEDENKTLSSKLSEELKRASEASNALKDAHAQELITRSNRIQALADKVKSLTARTLRADALQAGAREESLDELEIILQAYIGYDDNMEPFVKGPDGQPVIVQGRQQSIGSFVKDYLEKHAHHRKPATSYRPGRSRDGVSLTDQRSIPASERTAAVERVNGGDRSAAAVDALFKATRQKQPTG